MSNLIMLVFMLILSAAVVFAAGSTQAGGTNAGTTKHINKDLFKGE